MFIQPPGQIEVRLYPIEGRRPNFGSWHVKVRQLSVSIIRSNFLTCLILFAISTTLYCTRTRTRTSMSRVRGTNRSPRLRAQPQFPSKIWRIFSGSDPKIIRVLFFTYAIPTNTKQSEKENVEGPRPIHTEIQKQKRKFVLKIFVLVKINPPYSARKSQHVNHCYFLFWARLEGKFIINPKV